ncbi:hypothetical protein ACWEQL_03280 [Kitasatospora sp. NPDC004240]
MNRIVEKLTALLVPGTEAAAACTPRSYWATNDCYCDSVGRKFCRWWVISPTCVGTSYYKYYGVCA